MLAHINSKINIIDTIGVININVDDIATKCPYFKHFCNEKINLLIYKCHLYMLLTRGLIRYILISVDQSARRRKHEIKGISSEIRYGSE